MKGILKPYRTLISIVYFILLLASPLLFREQKIFYPYIIFLLIFATLFFFNIYKPLKKNKTLWKIKLILFGEDDKKEKTIGEINSR